MIVVDDADRAIGTEEKLAAHQPPGILHRALSVFLFDSTGRVLVQQRALTKHHFRGRWSNTCCTHPRPSEDVVAAGVRRLREEMGVRASLAQAGTFTYHAVDAASGLVEHELDHVLVGRFDGHPTPDPAEVHAWRWMEVSRLRRELAASPDRYTPWVEAALALAASFWDRTGGDPDAA